jgi:hypothetical protein
MNMSYYDLLRKAITQVKDNPEVSDETKTIILEKARQIYDLLGKLEGMTLSIEQSCGIPEDIIDNRFSRTEDIYTMLSNTYETLLQCYKKLSYNTHLLKSLYIASFTAAASSALLAINIQGLTITNLTAYAIGFALIVSGLALYKYKVGAYSLFTGSLIALLFESFTLKNSTNLVTFLAISILLIPLVSSLYIARNKAAGLLVG